MVADSASSLALQEVATKGGSGNAVSGSGAVTNGKRRARAPPPPSQTGKQMAVIAGRTEEFCVALMAQVCGELAAAGLAGPSTASASSFLSSYRDTADGIADTGLSSGRTAGLLPGGHVSVSFRLKLKSLRDALLCGVEGEKDAEEQPVPTAVATAIAGVGLEDLEIHPESVKRALRRGRCGGEAFVLAVQVTTMHSLSHARARLCFGLVRLWTAGTNRRGAVRLLMSCVGLREFPSRTLEDAGMTLIFFVDPPASYFCSAFR